MKGLKVGCRGKLFLEHSEKFIEKLNRSLQDIVRISFFLFFSPIQKPSDGLKQKNNIWFIFINEFD